MNLWESIVIILAHYKLPLITSMVCGATCGLMGTFVILRRMALIGDALSHSILPGVVIAFMIAGTAPWVMFTGAMIAGVITSLTISFLQSHVRVKEDSAVGLSFTFFFAIGIILISQLPRGTHFDLKCFLFGNPLAVHMEDLYMMLIVASFVCLLLFLFYRPLYISSFDPVMAVTVGINVTLVHYLMMTLLSATVVASLLAVGVIMVIAMIIAPGLTAYQLSDRLSVMLPLAGILGALSAGIGFVVAFWLNWPPGPAMTVVAGILFFIALLFSPKYGVVFLNHRKKLNSRQLLEEDVLKYLVRQYPKSISKNHLKEYLGIDRSPLKKILKILSLKNLLKTTNGSISLTGSGQLIAEEILRSHRLWETYLAQKGIASDQIHGIAEKLEHALEVADELDQALGNPTIDPHGSKIPSKNVTETL